MQWTASATTYRWYQSNLIARMKLHIWVSVFLQNDGIKTVQVRWVKKLKNTMNNQVCKSREMTHKETAKQKTWEVKIYRGDGTGKAVWETLIAKKYLGK